MIAVQGSPYALTPLIFVHSFFTETATMKEYMEKVVVFFIFICLHEGILKLFVVTDMKSRKLQNDAYALFLHNVIKAISE
jgi:hypothetical protein